MKVGKESLIFTTRFVLFTRKYLLLPCSNASQLSYIWIFRFINNNPACIPAQQQEKKIG
jgi:hypothetical protein